MVSSSPSEKFGPAFSMRPRQKAYAASKTGNEARDATRLAMTTTKTSASELITLRMGTRRDVSWTGRREQIHASRLMGRETKRKVQQHRVKIAASATAKRVAMAISMFI